MRLRLRVGIVVLAALAGGAVVTDPASGAQPRVTVFEGFYHPG